MSTVASPCLLSEQERQDRAWCEVMATMQGVLEADNLRQAKQMVLVMTRRLEILLEEGRAPLPQDDLLVDLEMWVVGRRGEC